MIAPDMSLDLIAEKPFTKPSTCCRQSDYNVITSGTNGYGAAAGYNLVTGLGTPVANLLVPDLIAYQGPGTSYTGPTVAALQNAGLVNTGTGPGSPLDVFSVFDSLTGVGDGRGGFQGQAAGAELGPSMNGTFGSADGGGNAGDVLFAPGQTVAPAAALGSTGLTLLARRESRPLRPRPALPRRRPVGRRRRL